MAALYLLSKLSFFGRLDADLYIFLQVRTVILILSIDSIDSSSEYAIDIELYIFIDC